VLGLGLGEDGIQHRLKRGRLHLLHQGVYSVGHRLIPREGQWLGAVFAAGPDAVLSHWSAAALWMIRPNSRTLVDVTIGRKSRSWGGLKRHHSRLPGDERVVEKGIPATSVPRTILDLAATESVDVVAAMLKESEYLKLHDRLSLPDLVERYPGRRGVRRVRLALERSQDDPVGRPRSRLEERFVPFVRRHRLPMPRLNDWILLGSERFLVDCHWPQARLIVELDSWQSHGTRSSFRSDRARDRTLLLAGYRVTRLTWAQLDDEPHEIATDLRKLLDLQS
jgi:very-short-patch-repair endonuclease